MSREALAGMVGKRVELWTTGGVHWEGTILSVSPASDEVALLSAASQRVAIIAGTCVESVLLPVPVAAGEEAS